MAEKERFIKADASQQEAIAKQFFTTTRDRKSTRLNSSHLKLSRMPSSA